jgi:hypothetical protein
VPLIPDVSIVDANVKADGATTSETVVDTLCAGLAESETLTVKLKLPTAVGVPVIIPVAAARLSPDGRLPEVIDQL